MLKLTSIFHTVAHSTEVPFVYGNVRALNQTPSANALSVAMIDYWVSFATSLDPNDGLGSERTPSLPRTTLSILTNIP